MERVSSMFVDDQIQLLAAGLAGRDDDVGPAEQFDDGHVAERGQGSHPDLDVGLSQRLGVARRQPDVADRETRPLVGLGW